jgi:hypothetical protein
MKNILIILNICLFIFSCDEKISKVKKDTNWSKDSIGCLGLRNKEYANNLIIDNGLLNMSKGTCIEFFGKPDVIEGDFFSQSLYYIAETNCLDGQLDSNTDRCYIIFYFKYNKFNYLSERCE